MNRRAIAQAVLRILGFSSVFEGANTSYKRRWINRQTTDTRRQITETVRSEILSKSRYLYWNVGIVKGAIRDMARYSIGSGLNPQAFTKDKGWNTAAEIYFQEWAKIADIRGLMTLHGLARCASGSIDTDGDIGFAMVKDGQIPKLLPLPGHRMSGNEDGFMDGVKLDSIGRPVSWRIVNGDNTKQQRIFSARDFIFLADPDRIDQYRGISSLHHAINNLWDTFEILNAEKLGVKLNSQIAIIESNEDGEADTGRSWMTQSSDATAKDVFTETLDDGQIRYVRAGSGASIKAHTQDRPSSTFTGFLDYLARDFASGIGLPVEFIWNPAGIQGTAFRAVLQRAQRRFDERREYLAIKLYARCWGWVISNAIKNGKLTTSEEWWKVRWQGPAKISVDVGREAQQNRSDIEAGIRSMQEDAGERGFDWLDLREQIEGETRDLLERADRLAKEFGVPMETAVNLLSRRGPNGLPPSSATPQ